MSKAGYIVGVALLMGCPPAFAQPQSMPPGSDDNFMIGLRRIGVLAGQSVICAPEATRPEEINSVSNAGNMIANEFGLRAAFNFIGAAGYGSGGSFDRATCGTVIKEWTNVQRKYGER